MRFGGPGAPDFPWAGDSDVRIRPYLPFIQTHQPFLFGAESLNCIERSDVAHSSVNLWFQTKPDTHVAVPVFTREAELTPEQSQSLPLAGHRTKLYSFSSDSPNPPQRLISIKCLSDPDVDADDAPQAPSKSDRIRLTISDLPWSFGLNAWNARVADEYLDALRTVRDGAPISFVPRFDVVDRWDEQVSWTGHWVLADGTTSLALDCDSCVHLANTGVIQSGRFGACLCVDGGALFTQSSQLMNVPMRFPLVRTDSGAPLRVDAMIRPTESACEFSLPQGDSSSQVPWLSFVAYPPTRVLGHIPARKAQALVRAGSLELGVVSAGGFVPSPDFQFSFEARFAATDRATLFPQLQIPRHTQSVRDAQLPLFSINPGGQDAVPGESLQASRDASALEDPFFRESPLIIPLRRNQSVAQQGPVLLALEVNESTSTGRDQSLQLEVRRLPDVNGAPDFDYSLLVLDRHPLLALRVDSSGEFFPEAAGYLANWSANALHGSSWEIVGGENENGFTLTLPPQGIGEAMERRKAPTKDIGESAAADFRFTPPTRIGVQTSYFKQRFVEPPWNLRRILGYPGQRAPGSALMQLRFELLYGMFGEYEPAGRTRIAELLSRVGALAGRMTDEPPWAHTSSQLAVFHDMKTHWRSAYGSVATRLAVLEPSETDGADDLTIASRLEVRLRKTAQLRWPFGDSMAEGGANDPPPHPTDGLAGSYAWAFESENIYRAVWRNPNAVTAALERPFFSSLGGWGYQVASFDKGLTTIQADIGMGRLGYFTLERIGRIGVLWHPAKHVIVYERTVGASEQFYKSQDGHAGRPLLRKVAEYVEITIPERQYPDAPAANVTRAFVKGCKFDSVRINVDGSWGADFEHPSGAQGWYVPLWNPNASVENPEVYPRPHIAFDLAADSATGFETESASILDPEKLVFWTDTTGERDTQTDLWPSVPEIDFPDAPVPQKSDLPSMDPAEPDRKLPDDVATADGFTRFTYRLGPTGRPVNVVAERSDQAMSAAIRNVTLQRAEPLPARSGVAKAAADAAVALRKARDKVDDVVPALASRIEEYRRAVGDFRSAADLERLRRELKEMVQGYLADARLKEISDAIDVDDIPIPADYLGERLKRTLESSIHRWRDRARDELKQLGERFRQEFAHANGEVARLKSYLRQESDRLVAALQPIRSGLNSVVAGVDRLKSTIEQAAVAGEAMLSRARHVIAALPDTSNEPERLRNELVQLLDQAEQEISQALQRMLGELGRDRAGEVYGLVQTILDQVNAAEAALRANTELMRNDIARLVSGNVGEIRQALESALTVISTEFAKFTSPDQALQMTIKRVKDAIFSSETNFNSCFNKLPAELRTADNLRGYFNKLINSLDPDGPTEVILASESLANDIRDKTNVAIGEILSAAGPLNDLKNKLINSTPVPRLQDALNELKAARNEWDRRLQNMTSDIHLRDLEQNIQKLGRNAGANLQRYAEELVPELSRIAGGQLAQQANSVFRLVRAFGEAPIVPNIAFNRDRVAYFFEEALRHVDMTPAAALVNRATDTLNDLKSLGVRLPTSQLLDRFLPDQLGKINLNDILPDFAGLKLTKFLPGLKFPSGLEDRVRISQGVDPQTLRAWFKAVIDVPLTGNVELFSFGPIAVRMLKSHLYAEADFEASAGAGASRRAYGRITADWQLIVAGYKVVTLRETALRFDDSGRLDFDLNPRKVDLSGALKFLADLMSKVAGDGSGLSIRPFEVDGRFAGIEAALAVALPPIQGVTFGISGLGLGTSFAIIAVPDFAIRTTFNLATREKPFTLTVFILGGGGWLEVAAEYLPMRGIVSTSLSIGISASASLAFSLGPVRGSVFIRFGIWAEFHASYGGPSQGLTVGIFLHFGGEVQVLWISVAISILLEATYQSNGALVGRGTLYIRIKLGWFFKITIRKSITYTFAKGGGTSEDARFEGRNAMAPSMPAASDQTRSVNYDEAADRYLDAFED